MQSNVSIAFFIFSFCSSATWSKIHTNHLAYCDRAGHVWIWDAMAMKTLRSFKVRQLAAANTILTIHSIQHTHTGQCMEESGGGGATDLPVRLYPHRLGISRRCSLPVLFCIPAQEHSVGREGDEQQPVNMRWPYCHCQFSMHYARTCFSASHDRTGALHVCVCVCARMRLCICVLTA